jgi:hypothetical protein
LAPPFLKVEKVEKIWLHLFSQVMKGGKNWNTFLYLDVLHTI